MAHRRALVVLDNAGSAAQVRPLLPGSGMVIVTSRRRLVDLDVARTISLDVLPERDALDLLTGIVGPRARQDPRALREIVELCGFLPLAVRIVGARWRTRPAWTAQDLGRRLAEQRLGELEAGERSVAKAFAVSYQQLTAEQQRLFRLLGLHTGDDWDACLAAAVLGTTRAAAERLLDALLDAHLVQQQENGRYRFHDLLADHAKASVAEDEREEAVVRVLDHYLNGAATAGYRLAPGRPRIHHELTHTPVDPPVFATPAQALAWLEAERRNLRAVVFQAAYQGHYRYAWQLPHHLGYFLLMRGSARERLELERVGLAAARQLGDLKARAEALRGLGSAYLVDGSAPDAVRHLEEALGLMRQIGDLRGEASTLGLLGMLARERAEYAEAMDHFQRGLALMREVGAPTGEANALQNIAIVHAEQEENETALAYLEQALSLLRAHHDIRSSAMVLHDIAYVHYNEFRDEQCLAAADRSLRLYREAGDQRGEALAAADFGYMIYEMGEWDRAGEVLRGSLRLSRQATRQPDTAGMLAAMEEVDDRTGLITVLIALTIAAELEGRPVEALSHAERCLALVREVGPRFREGRLLGQLSRLHLRLGDTAQAVRYGEAAVRYVGGEANRRAKAVARRVLDAATAEAAATTSVPAAPAS
ncbi:hypothetical protein BBK82_06560 [Lentzea guizhouensis]|uniref:Uncharacterized protein n=1 Tax=Lentzea guizhouensis TaxID=1586287 RepID=A0A1B2HDN7_9PSEU|nr:tetratricopeptide repeat protein [Lentzea guizhouensis]ANZ35796.1 hypothetical protein BBK82_06560 [Lentzea guizhouensis]